MKVKTTLGQCEVGQRVWYNGEVIWYHIMSKNGDVVVIKKGRMKKTLNTDTEVFVKI